MNENPVTWNIERAIEHLAHQAWVWGWRMAQCQECRRYWIFKEVQ
jgi:hypothetical protein